MKLEAADRLNPSLICVATVGNLFYTDANHAKYSHVYVINVIQLYLFSYLAATDFCSCEFIYKNKYDIIFSPD